MRIISAHSHVLEPHGLWATRLAGTPFAHRAPAMVDDGVGGHLFAADGLRPLPIGLAGADAAELAAPVHDGAAAPYGLDARDDA